MSNIKRKIIALSLTLGILTGCNVMLKPSQQAKELIKGLPIIGDATNQPVHIPDSIIVCRSKQCAPANLSMSAEYIYNSLISLFQNNNHHTALICQGNETTHSCIETYISMPITVGITPAYAYIDSVKISDVNINKGKKTLN